MGSESISHKQHYDISMSKRTRKPAKIQDELQNFTSKDDGLSIIDKGDRSESNNDHKSLKQLISGEGKAETRLDEGNRERNSLGQHFSKEEINNLQIVKKQHQDGLQGVKLKKVVGKFLRNLIKGGGDHQHQLMKKPTRKKSFL
ncbi:uncharacterized protein E5676_scaffold459G001280 [Cucumis melo var. makuwa]|uniref:Uncharacterized protein LOC103499874 n=2 Tax=Cucumis melo TaxID=3656 RepID=A0A1S3CFF2_CUCME|nr:uncharacterized protein LOC103499874 [Cucumis melo]KAA0058672.1 uncharacterized protein E6C27_scaffold339G001420 [Cucumis melo var. makuwa]TYK10479.1 uncharacterized protein E5676_scaffold459G001280 [Cucumis melo var. makuwa]